RTRIDDCTNGSICTRHRADDYADSAGALSGARDDGSARDTAPSLHPGQCSRNGTSDRCDPDNSYGAGTSDCCHGSLSGNPTLGAPTGSDERRDRDDNLAQNRPPDTTKAA